MITEKRFIYYTTPPHPLLVNSYFDGPLTLKSTDQNRADNAVLSRRAFTNALKNRIYERIKERVKPYIQEVKPHIFGGGAQECLGGPIATDMDIRIDRSTFFAIKIEEVGTIIQSVVASIIGDYASKNHKNLPLSEEDIVQLYDIKIHPHGNTTLIKVGDQIDISVSQLLSDEPLSHSGVDGFSYDFVKNRFSCVAGTEWCDKYNYTLNVTRMHTREYIAACPLKTEALFHRLVHVRAHAYSLQASDVAIAKKQFRNVTNTEANKKIWQGLKAHFRSPKESLVDLMTALSMLQDDPELAKKYADNWMQAKSIGTGPEIFLGQVVGECPAHRAAALSYLYCFFLLEYAYSQKLTIEASEFQISNHKLTRPMFSLQIGNRPRFIPLRNDGPFPSPLQIIRDFFSGREELIDGAVKLEGFKRVLDTFEFESAHILEQPEFVNRIVRLWLQPKIQALQYSTNPKENPKELLLDLLRMKLKAQTIHLIHETIAKLDLIAAIGHVPERFQTVFRLLSTDVIPCDKNNTALLASFFEGDLEELTSKCPDLKKNLSLILPAALQTLMQNADISFIQFVTRLVSACLKAKLITKETGDLTANLMLKRFSPGTQVANDLYLHLSFWVISSDLLNVTNSSILSDVLPCYKLLCLSREPIHLQVAFHHRKKALELFQEAAPFITLIRGALASKDGKLTDIAITTFDEIYAQKRAWMTEVLKDESNKDLFVQIRQQLDQRTFSETYVPLELALLEAGAWPSNPRKKELQEHAFLLLTPQSDTSDTRDRTSVAERLLRQLVKIEPSIDCTKPLLRRMERLLEKKRDISWDRLELFSSITVLGDERAQALVEAIREKDQSKAKSCLTVFKTQVLPRFTAPTASSDTAQNSVDVPLQDPVPLLTDEVAHVSIALKDSEQQKQDGELTENAKSQDQAQDPAQDQVIEVTDELSLLSLSDNELSTQNMETVMSAYLKTTVNCIQESAFPQEHLRREFTILWETVATHIQSDEDKELLSTCIVGLYANRNKTDFQLGMNRCIQEVMQGTDVAIKFLEEICFIPNEFYDDASFLQDAEALFKVVCRRHLSKTRESFGQIARKLINFLLSIFLERPGQVVSKRVFEFIKSQFLFLIDEADQAKDKMPLDLDLMPILIKAISITGPRHQDLECVSTCFSISKRYTPSHHEKLRETSRSFLSSTLDQLPKGKDSEHQERCFKHLIALFPVFQEILPHQLLECLKKLETCVLDAKTHPLFYQILHMAFDAFKTYPAMFVELVTKNMEKSLRFQLRETSESAISLLEKLQSLSFKLPVDETRKLVQVHYFMTRHLFYIALKRGSFGTGEGLIDRYYQRVFPKLQKQIIECCKTEEAFIRTLFELNISLKSFGQYLNFMPHWFRWFSLVNNELLKKQNKSLINLNMSEQVLILKQFVHMQPAELKSLSSEDIENISVIAISMLVGLTAEEIHNLQNKANSPRLLDLSLRLLKMYFESQITASQLKKKSSEAKKLAQTMLKDEVRTILTSIEKTFEMVFKRHEPLKKMLLDLKAQMASKSKR